MSVLKRHIKFSSLTAHLTISQFEHLIIIVEKQRSSSVVHVIAQNISLEVFNTMDKLNVLPV